MPTDEERARIEIEVALRNLASGALQQLAQSLDLIQRKASDSGTAGAASLGKVIVQTERLTERANQSNRSLASLATTFASAFGFAGAIGTGVGVAAYAVVQTADALDKFATSKLRLKAFTQDVELTQHRVRQLQQDFARLGYSPEQFQQMFGGFADRIKELRASKVGRFGAFWDEMSQIEGGAAFVDSLMKILKEGGGIDDVFIAIVRKYEEMGRYGLPGSPERAYGEQFQRRLMRAAGFPLTVYIEYMEAAAKRVEVLEPDPKNIETVHKTITDVRILGDNIITRMEDRTIEHLLGIKKGIDEIAVGKTGAGVFDTIINLWKTLSPGYWLWKLHVETKKSLEAAQQDLQRRRDRPRLPFDRQGRGPPRYHDGTGGLKGTATEFSGRQREGVSVLSTFMAALNPESLDEKTTTTNKLLVTIRDELEEIFGVGGGGWMDHVGGGPRLPFARQGRGTPRYRDGGGGGGPVDESGRRIDPETMKEIDALAAKGDTRGMQRVFSRSGYRMSGRACGVVASLYALSGGYRPPPGRAIATNWHRWGEQVTAEAINKQGTRFGSLFATYYHRRYGGGRGLLRVGETGGHVMAIIPGSYDPRTRTALFVDQSGHPHRRSLHDLNLRRGTEREILDRRSAAESSAPKTSAEINFHNVPSNVRTEATADADEFKTSRSRNIQGNASVAAP